MLTEWDKEYFASDQFKALNKANNELPKEETVSGEMEGLICKMAKMAQDALDTEEWGIYESMIKGIEICERVAQHDRENASHRFRVSELQALGMEPTTVEYKGLTFTAWAEMEGGKIARDTVVHVFLGANEVTKIIGEDVAVAIISALEGGIG
jgi:hypothetical protein